MTTEAASRQLPGGGPRRYSLTTVLSPDSIIEDDFGGGGGSGGETSEPTSSGVRSEDGLECAPNLSHRGPFDGRAGDLAEHFRAHPVDYQQATTFLENNTVGWECRSRALSDLEVPKAVAGWMIRLAHGDGDGVIDRPAEREAADLVGRWIGDPIEIPGITATVSPTGEGGGGGFDLGAWLDRFTTTEPTTTTQPAERAGFSIAPMTLILAAGVVLAVVLAARRS